VVAITLIDKTSIGSWSRANNAAASVIATVKRGGLPSVRMMWVERCGCCARLWLPPELVAGVLYIVPVPVLELLLMVPVSFIVSSHGQPEHDSKYFLDHIDRAGHN